MIWHVAFQGIEVACTHNTAFENNEQNFHFHEGSQSIQTGTYFRENGAQMFFQGRALSSS